MEAKLLTPYDGLAYSSRRILRPGFREPDPSQKGIGGGLTHELRDQNPFGTATYLLNDCSNCRYKASTSYSAACRLFPSARAQSSLAGVRHVRYVVLSPLQGEVVPVFEKTRYGGSDC